MRGIVFSRLRAATSKFSGDQRGNAMMLTAAALLPVVGIVGSGIDIGRAYMTQLRLQQACDAGVLAGRRAMAGSGYLDPAKAEANKMFNFNFPAGNYGSRDIGFSSWSDKPSDVAGRATAVLPTAIMYIFGKTQFDLAVDCTAKLEISNVDVMLVLDVTGSMRDKAVSTDTDTKIVALRKASIDFFDTLTKADVGDGRLRFGVVPYSSSVNVGQILIAKNANWIADEVELPSRTPKTKIVYANPSYDPEVFISDTPNADVFDKDLAKCDGTLPTDTTPQPGDPVANRTEQFVDADGNRVSYYNIERTYSYYKYKEFTNSSGKCREGRYIASFKRKTTQTVTETPTKVFDDKYIYDNRSFDTRPLKTGSTIESDTGDKAGLVTTSWAGCIIERDTSPFASNQTAPSDALDMDINTPPTVGDVDTQWKMFLPDLTYNRNQVSPLTTSTDYDNFVEKGGDYAACPVPAMNLETMTQKDHDRFAGYINTLQPKGYTYHDAGMAWGARLISPNGLFADQNGPYNGRPISRHVIFMTDGEMNTPRANMSHQGQERSMPRIGATSDSDAIARHNNRFVQLCQAARREGVTIWVVSFGVGSNTNLNSCASSGAAYEADDASQLNSQFQAIARQISKLRLSQ